MAKESTPIIVKAGFLLFPMALSAVAWTVCKQPLPHPLDAQSIQIKAGTFAVYQAFASLIVLPLLMRKLVKSSPYNYSHMLIALAFHENGFLLGFVLALSTHDFRYLVYFAVPCLSLLALTPVGEMPKPKS